MSRKGNCWDNRRRKAFYGRMKDHIGERIPWNVQHTKEIHTIIDDWMDYYNNDRYQWRLSKLSPNEYYQYITTVYIQLRGKSLLSDIDKRRR